LQTSLKEGIGGEKRPKDRVTLEISLIAKEDYDSMLGM
jgi:hypothetical protein